MINLYYQGFLCFTHAVDVLVLCLLAPEEL